MKRPVQKHEKALLHGRIGEDKMELERLRSIRLFELFAFLVWPILLVAAPVAALIILIMDLFRRNTSKAARFFRLVLNAVLLPLYVVVLAVRQRNPMLVLGYLLLMPFVVMTILGVVSDLAFDETTPAARGSRSVGGPAAAERGATLESLLTGASLTYFASLVATLLVLSLGLWLGKLTFGRIAEAGVMAFVQSVEAIPLLFLLLVVMAVFSWWGYEWKDSLGPSLTSVLRVLVIGVVVGVGFLPRMIRLISERIKTFGSQDFVDGTKAHGIAQNRILWYHIIAKNCLNDVIIAATQIWASAIVIEVSLDYLIAKSPLSGAKVYPSWAGMLLTDEVKVCLLQMLPDFRFEGCLLCLSPALLIIMTVIGLYLLGDGLRAFYLQEAVASKPSSFDRALDETLRSLGSSSRSEQPTAAHERSRS